MTTHSKIDRYFTPRTLELSPECRILSGVLGDRARSIATWHRILAATATHFSAFGEFAAISHSALLLTFEDAATFRNALHQLVQRKMLIDESSSVASLYFVPMFARANQPLLPKRKQLPQASPAVDAGVAFPVGVYQTKEFMALTEALGGSADSAMALVHQLFIRLAFAVESGAEPGLFEISDEDVFHQGIDGLVPDPKQAIAHLVKCGFLAPAGDGKNLRCPLFLKFNPEASVRAQEVADFRKRFEAHLSETRH